MWAYSGAFGIENNILKYNVECARNRTYSETTLHLYQFSDFVQQK